MGWRSAPVEVVDESFLGLPPTFWHFVGSFFALMAFVLVKNFVEARRPKGDVFKRIFVDLCDGDEVQGATTITTSAFIHALQRFEREGGATSHALRLLSLLAGEHGKPDKPIARGTTKSLNALFAAMDDNGDGQITWAEWTKYVAHHRSVIASDIYEGLSKTKKKAIGAGMPDGVDTKEFCAGLEAVPYALELFNLNGSQTRTMLKSIDANRDGVVTWGEFKACVENSRMTKAPSFLKIL